jgi:hypothetical protein
MFLRRKPKKKPKRPAPERRREPRTEDLNLIILEPRGELPPGIGRGVYYAQTRNASASGLKLETDVEFPVGMVLTIKLKSPRTRKEIKAAGAVKWVHPLKDGSGFVTGVEFVETALETVLNLVEHIYKA